MIDEFWCGALDYPILPNQNNKAIGEAERKFHTDFKKRYGSKLIGEKRKYKSPPRIIAEWLNKFGHNCNKFECRELAEIFVVNFNPKSIGGENFEIAVKIMILVFWAKYSAEYKNLKCWQDSAAVGFPEYFDIAFTFLSWIDYYWLGLIFKFFFIISFLQYTANTPPREKKSN